MKRKVNNKSLANLRKGRPRVEIDETLLIELKNKGWSIGRLTNKFGASRSTIKQRLRKLQPKEKSQEIMTFALKLEQLAENVASNFCRKEVNRLVHFLRTRAALSDEDKKLIILKSFVPSDMPKDEVEIAEDCGFDKAETSELLAKLVEENRLEARTRGGVANRGRKIKYNYFLR